MQSYDTLSADRAAKKARYEDLKRQTEAALWDYLEAGEATQEAYDREGIGKLPAFLNQYETQRAGLAHLGK